MMARGLSATSYKEDIFPSLLSIQIKQVRNIHWGDVVTDPDLYVCLWMPSATERKFKTKTVSNSSGPSWGETFQFKIYSNIKNILHLSVKDEDVITKDDHLYTVFFDVGNLPLDVAVTKCFPLNPEGKEELEVELKMTTMSDPSEKIITNGVIVSRDVSCVEVQIDKKKSGKVFNDNEALVLTVSGSYKKTEKTQLSSGSGSVDTIRFRAVKSWDPHLTANLEGSHITKVTTTLPIGTSNDLLNLPLKSFPVGQEVNMSLSAAPVHRNCCCFCCHLPLLKTQAKKLELKIKVSDCPENLDMRMGFDLCQEEKDFLQKRKQLVAGAVKATLGLDRDLKEHEVPIIAVTTTGGGARAMTSLFGTLSGLKKMNLLDSVSYITGASGSTWCMSKLYEDADWSSKDLTDPIEDARKHMAKSKIHAFSLDRLKYYYNEMSERSKAGQPVSFTDMWGLIIESMFHDGENNVTLSDQQKALNRGQNPLPLYLAMNVKNIDKSTLDFKEWCEFSPYEVGLLKYGAYIRAEHFNSNFFMGRLVKKLKESRICYLQGLWSNIFSINLLDAWFSAVSSEGFWKEWIRDPLSVIEEDAALLRRRCSNLTTRVLTAQGIFSENLKDILTNRPLDGEHHNFLNGIQIHENYNKNQAFCSWQDSELDLFPDQLTPSSEKLCLVDSAYYINASFPPLLRDERKVDIILSFDYGLANKFKSVEQTCEYCRKQGITFPKIAVRNEDKENPKECHVFKEADNPDAPIVLHFPLVNDTFKQFKAPGVPRKDTEMEDGHVRVSGVGTPYRLLNMTYDERAFNQLLNLTEYNVMNNREQIVQALRTATERKRSSRK